MGKTYLVHYTDSQKRTKFYTIVNLRHKKGASSYQRGYIYDKYSIKGGVEFDFGESCDTTKVYIYFNTYFSDEEIEVRVRQAEGLSHKVVEEINSIVDRLEHVQNYALELLEKAFQSD